MRILALLLVAGGVVPLTAQQPDSTQHRGMPGHMGMHGGMGMGAEGMMGHMRQMMGPMMRVMALTPDHLLMHREQLRLTDQQVAKLTALRDAARASGDAARTEAETHQRALAAAFAAATADTNQIKTHFQAMQAAMAKGHWAMFSAAAQARALLTETQRARADGWADVMEMMPPMDHSMQDRPTSPH